MRIEFQIETSLHIALWSQLQPFVMEVRNERQTLAPAADIPQLLCGPVAPRRTRA
jgi:hypothetical protein